MEASHMRKSQLDALSVIERVCSVFSLLGCVFIIGTFCASRAFHKPINRLVFYASFGNLMTNIATLMARSYVGDGNSAACQFQAFLIQMFMPADACWTLAMAVNVYLTFYFKFDAQRLRRMELPYLLICYGVPFTIALTYVFISTPDKGNMYGNATLWCWVRTSWDIFRIATFYGPVWIVILVTIFIYFRAGREIYKKHKQLRQVYYSSHHDPDPLPPMDDLWCSSKTTEVHVTSEVVNRDTIDLSVLGPRGSVAVAVVGSEQQVQVPNAAYSVTISASSRQQQRESLNDMTPPIPSTAAAARQNQNLPVTQPHRRRAAYEANNAAWSYAKCAILFFTAMLVTWIPSSANRVFSVVNAGMVSLPLEFMSAFVLPLQGFWNACIYIVTSWKACKTLGEDIFQFRVDRHRPSVDELVGIHGRIHGEGGQGGGTKTDGSDRHVHFSRMSDKDERGSSVGDGGGGNVRHPSESFSFASSGSAGEKSQV